MIGISLLGLLLGIFSARTSAKASQGYGFNLRQAMFRQIQTFSFADIDTFFHRLSCEPLYNGRSPNTRCGDANHPHASARTDVVDRIHGDLHSTARRSLHRVLAGDPCASCHTFCYHAYYKAVFQRNAHSVRRIECLCSGEYDRHPCGKNLCAFQLRKRKNSGVRTTPLPTPPSAPVFASL